MMMTKNVDRPCQRRGAAVVEAAVVLGFCMLLLFSIFEYGRLVMTDQIIVNAAREGCRYAIVHATDSTIVTDVNTQVTNFMGPATSQVTGLIIEVYPSSNPGASNTATAMNNLQPDDDVTVRITGQFHTMFPTLLFLPVTFQMRSSSIMTCEGN